MSTFRHRPSHDSQEPSDAARPAVPPSPPGEVLQYLAERAAGVVHRVKERIGQVLDAIYQWLRSDPELSHEVRRLPATPVEASQFLGDLSARTESEDRALKHKVNDTTIALVKTTAEVQAIDALRVSKIAVLARLKELSPEESIVASRQAKEREAQEDDEHREEASAQVLHHMAMLAAQMQTVEAAKATKAAEADHQDQVEREREAHERRVAEQAVLTAAVAMSMARDSLVRADQASPRPDVDRTEKRASNETPEAAQVVRARARKARDLIADEATYPIPWKAEPELCGFRPPPPGTFLVAIAQPSPHARVVGALGRLACVDWAATTAVAQATAILAAVTPAAKRGQPPKHVGHIVLAKPAAESWGESSTAMRAARHALRAVGVDPDRHDVVVFHHAQRSVKRPGYKDKNEEALHIIYSRVRDDGALHDCRQALVASALGRARWDDAAGVNPDRLGSPSQKSKPIRDGLQAIKDRTLEATYKKDGMVEKVPLLGRVHGEALAQEGYPDPGVAAGIWTPKPCYRSRESIEDILNHCAKGK